MSTLLKAYLMETDNPFLMFKCFYEDIKGLTKATEYKDILKEDRATNPAHTFFQDALEDKGNDELREAYETMKQLRQEMKHKNKGIGQDIFSIDFRMPRGATKDDPFPNSPYAKTTRQDNLFALKRHLSEIKREANRIKTHQMNPAYKKAYRRKLKEVQDKIKAEEKKRDNKKAMERLRKQLEYIRKVINENKNVNPASVKRLTEAIDVWLKNIPKMMPKLKTLTQREVREITGSEQLREQDEPALGIKRPKSMETDIKGWMKKLNQYERNLEIFLTQDENAKERIIRRFFTTGKIDELEDIADGTVEISEEITMEGIDDLRQRFNRLKKNLNQNRPEGKIVEQLDKAYKDVHKVRRLSKDKRKEKRTFFDNIRRKLPKGTIEPRTIIHSKGPKKEYIARQMKRMEEDLDSWLDKEGLEGEDRKNRRGELLEAKKHEMEKFKKRIEEIYDKESKRLHRKDSPFEDEYETPAERTKRAAERAAEEQARAREVEQAIDNQIEELFREGRIQMGFDL